MDSKQSTKNVQTNNIGFSPQLKSNKFFPADKSPNMFLEKLKMRIQNMELEEELNNDELTL